MVFIYKCIHGYGIKHSNNYKHTKCSILAHRAKHSIISAPHLYKCMFLSCGELGIQAPTPVFKIFQYMSSF